MAITLITGVVKYHQLTTPVRFVWILILISCISEFYSPVFAQKNTFQNSTGLHHLLLISRYSLVAMIYYHFSTYPFLKKFSLFSILPVLFMGFGFSLYVQKVTVVPSTMLLLTGTLIVLLSLLSFIEMMRNPVEKPLLQQPLFWFNTGNLIFCAATSMFFGFYHLLPKGGYKNFLLEILFVVNIILYLCYFLVIVVDKQVKTSKDE